MSILTSPTRSRLPTEVVDIIIDFLHNDKRSLAACSLVARNWLPSSRYHLIPSISTSFPITDNLLNLVNSPHSMLVSSIRKISLVSATGDWFTSKMDANTTETITFLEFAERFRRLHAFEFLRFDWRSVDHRIPQSNNITKLAMLSCVFDSCAQYFAVLSSLPALEDLSTFYLVFDDEQYYTSSTDTVSPSLKKLLILSYVVPLKIARWLTSKPLPNLQTIVLDYPFGELKDVMALQPLISHVAPTLTDLEIVVPVQSTTFQGSGSFLNLRQSISLQTLVISLDVENTEVAYGNASFLPKFIASVSSAAMRQIKFVIKVNALQSFASLERVLVELRNVLLLNTRDVAEVTIYSGLERIARGGKLYVQYGHTPFNVSTTSAGKVYNRLLDVISSTHLSD
ncbi:hypothetical protein BDN70DRAFT_578100 [Pholiota conissans]|uniref:F-box domain-containing protein n=1 Tax=Pholiota conissans TaxID=109636 RepID=A0A9P5Z6L3_9AGAR|nr:hypothetical protein BDN70DRAFT_578100 [Pholiota conissans]